MWSAVPSRGEYNIWGSAMNHNHATSAHTRPRRDSGFSITELAVAITILGIALAVTVPSFNNSLRRARYDRAAGELQSDLRLAISEAKATGRTLILDFGADGYNVMDAADSSMIRTRSYDGGLSFAATGDPLIFPWGLVQPAEVAITGQQRSHNFQILPTGKVEMEMESQ
jgi:prepilin-type N-terminal cleavage/methylation domain-containing protein